MAIDKKKLLADTLIRLCETKHLSKITVRDILEETGLSRQTFYNYFIDKNDLINWTYYSKVTGAIRDLDERGLAGFLIDAHKYSIEHKNFFTQACSLSGQNNLKEYMFQHHFENHLNYIIEQYGQDVVTDGLLWALEYHAYGSIHMHIKWVADGMPLSPEKKTQYIIGCIPTILHLYLPITSMNPSA